MSSKSDIPKSGVFGEKPTKSILIIAAVIILLTVSLYALDAVSPLATLRVIAGGIYTMFLPGFLLCWLIFPESNEINLTERAGLSFGLSIPLTLSAVLVADWFLNIPLTAKNIIWVLGVLMSVLLLACLVRPKLLTLLSTKTAHN